MHSKEKLQMEVKKKKSLLTYSGASFNGHQNVFRASHTITGIQRH